MHMPVEQFNGYAGIVNGKLHSLVQDALGRFVGYYNLAAQVLKKGFPKGFIGIIGKRSRYTDFHENHLCLSSIEQRAARCF
jgi:hypothetical protein